MKIIILVLAALAASIIDFKKDKTTFIQAWKTNWIKYVGMVVGGYLVTSVPEFIFAALVATGIYYGWTFISQVVIGLYNKYIKK